MADRRLLNQINVTPFVDVMLVLLIIFMVTAPMMREGIDVDLPDVEASGISMPEEPLVITINKKGEVFINETSVKVAKLRVKLKAIVKRRKDKMVLLKADSSVKYGQVAKVMAEVRGAGIEKLGMMTEPEGSSRKR